MEPELSEDSLIVAAMRVADFPDPVPGSQQRICGRCGEPVWLSPASLAALETTAVTKIHCLQCLNEECAST